MMMMMMITILKHIQSYYSGYRDQALYCTSGMNGLLMAGMSTYNIHLSVIIISQVLLLHAALTSDDPINLLLMY